MENLAEEVVFITGGAQGIGLSLARAFLAEGAAVAVADVDRGALDSAYAELTKQSRPYSVLALKLDVRDRDAFVCVADEVEARLGAVSVLCNNAGIRVPDALPQLGYDLWDLVVGVNLNGVYNGIQTFLPRMVDRGKPGHIVNTASAAGLAIHPNSYSVGSSGLTYTTSKSAVVALSETLDFDLRAANHPIGVTVLCPGLVSTKISSNSVVLAGLSAEAREYADQGDSLLGQHGESPDLVGQSVVRAIRSGQLYLHTDRTMSNAVARRNDKILSAMPRAETS